MKTQVGKALSFIFFIYLSSFFFPGRLRGGPHGVNHPCQDVDLVEHLPESHPTAALLLPLLGWLSLCPASLFICLSIPWSPDTRLLLSPSPSIFYSLSLPHYVASKGDNHRRIPQDREQRRSLDIKERSLKQRGLG